MGIVSPIPNNPFKGDETELTIGEFVSIKIFDFEDKELP